jgi:hypothetical protein
VLLSTSKRRSLEAAIARIGEPGLYPPRLAFSLGSSVPPTLIIGDVEKNTSMVVFTALA